MTDSAPDTFAAWLSGEIAQALKTRGYAKSGSTFHRRAKHGWGVVNFQKSAFGSRNETRFTINLGVALDRLATAEGDDPRKKPPANRCQWSCRLGMTVEDDNDRWWIVDGGTNLAGLAAEVLPLVLNVGLPLLDERISEGGFLAAMQRSPTVGWVRREPQVMGLLAGVEPST